MSRTIRGSAVAAALAMLAAVGFGFGCGTRGAGQSGPSPVNAIPTASPAGKEKLFADWPKPAGALVISGQQDGYLEPCGCTEGQKGGLGRRLDLLDRLHGQKWSLALIDLGSLILDPASDRGGPEEVKLKLDVALQALEAMKYDALALSADDLKPGVADTLMRVANTLKERPKIVAANVAPAPGLVPEGVFRTSVRTSAGPIRLGITAVLDPETLKALSDPDKDSLLTIKDPAEALPPVLAELEKDTDVQVLMVQGPPEKARALAESHPGFDLVVATSPHPDPAAHPVELNGGKTQLISVGRKGQYVGVVGLFREPGHPVEFRYQRVMLGPRYRQAEPMRKLIDEDFQETLKQARVVEDFPRRAFVGGAPGAQFVGAQACRTCHPNTFAKWQSTRHAHAYEGLLKPRRNREFDAECVSCHTTGFQYLSGFRSAQSTAFLKGNQCENCHGPASRHIEDPDNADFRRALALTRDRADRNRLCLQCHDEDNAPHFKFEVDYSKIAHKGMDTYSDPKVHARSN